MFFQASFGFWNIFNGSIASGKQNRSCFINLEGKILQVLLHKQTANISSISSSFSLILYGEVILGILQKTGVNSTIVSQASRINFF